MKARTIAPIPLIVALVAGQAWAGGDAAAGRAIARTNCGDCHAIGARDVSPLPPAPPFRELVAHYPSDSLQEALAEGISVGHPMMPQVEMTPKQIADFEAYLRTLPPARKGLRTAPR